MASQSTNSVKDSSILVKTDTLVVPTKALANMELHDFSLDHKNFTVKTLLTDTTFIIEGKKIYAGSDFLSLVSPYFNALLKGGFAERNKEEIELKDVAYEKFHSMLEYLCDQSRKIKADDVESLLTLGDRFDIKCLVDRVEEYIIKSKEFTAASKLLLADRFCENLKLVKLYACCFDSMCGPNDQTVEEVVRSDDFKQFSVSAKKLFFTVAKTLAMDYPGRDNSKVKFLHEVENVEEPANGFIAKGVLGGRNMDMAVFFQYVDIAGLIWSMELDCGEDGIEPYLVVNKDRPTGVEWSVEGFVEMETKEVDVKTNAQVDSKVVKYSFSFNNSKRVSKLRRVQERDRKYYEIFVTIYITKVSGLRENLKFDFSASSEQSDVIVKVQGKEFNVNKQYLSTISPRFRDMFYKYDDDGNELKKVDLKNVDSKDFAELLNWMYPSTWSNVTASSSFAILMAADKLKIDIDSSIIHNYISLLSAEAFFPERAIFWFQFNIGNEEDLDGHGAFSLDFVVDLKKAMKTAENKVKNCPFSEDMFPEKKLALYAWIREEAKRCGGRHD